MIVFEFNPWLILQFVVSGLLPLVVGLVTSKATPGVVKGCILAGLTILISFGAELLAWWNAGGIGNYDLFAALMTSGMAFTFAVAAQFGIYSAKDRNGVSLTDKAQAATALQVINGPRHRQG